MNWQEYVENFASGEDSRLESINFSFPDIQRRQPSFFTRINAHLISEFELMEQNRAVVFYPHSDELFLSVIFTKIIKDIVNGNSDTSSEGNISSLRPGDRFKLGEAVLECLGTEVVDGKECLRYRYNTRTHCVMSSPIENLPRIVEVVPKTTALSSKETFERSKAKHSRGSIYREDLDTLADMIKRGRRVHERAVLIVSRDDKFSKAIEEFTINDQKVSDLISMFRAKYDGSLISIGKSGATPQVIIAPTLPAAYLAAATFGKISEVFIDGASFRSLYEFETDLFGILDTGAPTFIFIPETSSLDISLLFDYGFEAFRWIPALIGGQIILHSDPSCEAYLRAVSQNRIIPYCVENVEISKAFAFLNEAQKSEDIVPRQVTDSIALLTKYLFLVSRRCAPFREDEKRSLLERGDDVIGAMMSPEVFSHLADKAKAKQLVSIWHSLRAQIEDPHPLKEVALGCDLLIKKDLLGKQALLIVPNDFCKDGVVDALRETLSGVPDKPEIAALTYDEFLDCQSTFDYVFVCGWLGRERMKRILFSNLAPAYVPVLYDFELPWLRLAFVGWNEEFSKSNISILLPEIQEPSLYKVDVDESWLERPETDSESDDYDDVVRGVQKLQWHGNCEILPGDVETEGRLVAFSDGSFGVFSRGYSVTKVPTPYEEGQSLSTVSSHNLFVGDIVLFGDSDHDLLVDESNKLLSAEGHPDAYVIASSWRDALRAARNSGLTEDEIIDALVKAGITRSDAVFRQWLDDEPSTICPRSKEDLLKMGLALGDELLVDMVDEIYENAKVVYSARVRTGKSLMQKLLRNIEVNNAIRRLRSASTEFSRGSFLINVEGLGRIEFVSVVEVGQIERCARRVLNQRKVF